MPGRHPPATKGDGVRVFNYGKDMIKSNIEDASREADDDIGGWVHLASEEEIRAGNGDGVFRPLQEVSWL